MRLLFVAALARDREPSQERHRHRLIVFISFSTQIAP